MVFFKSMMSSLRNAKKEMRARIVELERENTALLSKVSTLEQDRERFQKKLVLTGQELLTARRQARENMCALTKLRNERNENEKTNKNREESICKECRSRSSMVEKLQSRVAGEDVENRALQKQLVAQCETKRERLTVTEPQKAESEKKMDSEFQKIESESMQGDNCLTEAQAEQIPDGSQEDFSNVFAARLTLPKAVERVYQGAEEKSEGPDGEGTCEARIGCMEDSARKKPYLIPSKDVLPKGILRPPREHVESEKDNDPYWLETPPLRARKCPTKVGTMRCNHYGLR